jgi:hydroxypyruvate isomerase
VSRRASRADGRQILIEALNPLDAPDYLLETLRAARYGGWLGAEYVPSIATEASLRWLKQRRELRNSR